MNDGLINERILIEYINNNSFDDYTDNIKNFLFFAFEDNINTNLPFYSDKIVGQLKPDILIKHNNVTKYISIKKGNGNSVHQESINDFFPFIASILDDKSLEYLKLYHFGDDTLDDSGSIRYSARECKNRYPNEIIYLNQKINDWTNLIKFLDRFLFYGNLSKISVDIIYHGTINEGHWASKEEIINYIKNSIFHTNGVHFGPLSYQVWGRNEKKTALHPDRRYIMQIKWSSLKKDLFFIRSNKNV